VLQDEGALRWDGQFATSPLAALPQLRLGAALGLSMVLDDEKFIIHSSGGATFIGSADMPLYMLEPEIRLSWRQHLDAGKVWYIEPGIGAGGAFANLSLDGEDTSTGESFDEWDDTWTTRVYLNVGARVVGGLAGVQASYMRGGEIDFAEEASGDLEQWFIGIFGALQF
jgi:hypothetical protein